MLFDVPKLPEGTTLTIEEAQRVVDNVIDSYNDAIKEFVVSEELQMKIAVSAAAGVFKRTLLQAAEEMHKQKSAEQATIDALKEAGFATGGIIANPGGFSWGDMGYK